MQTKMGRGLDHYITVFRDLIEITGTPLAMAYAFFFMGLPDDYKEEMTKQYPDSEPETMQEVYESVGTIERALQFTRRRSIPVSDRKPKENRGKSIQPQNDAQPSNYSVSKKDRNAVSWGPAKEGEKGTYRRNKRCLLCGHKWTLEHSCAKDSESKPQGKDPKA